MLLTKNASAASRKRDQVRTPEEAKEPVFLVYETQNLVNARLWSPTSLHAMPSSRLKHRWLALPLHTTAARCTMGPHSWQSDVSVSCLHGQSCVEEINLYQDLGALQRRHRGLATSSSDPSSDQLL